MTAPTDEFELAAAPAVAPAARHRRRWTRRPGTWAAVAGALVLAGVVAAPPLRSLESDGVAWNLLDLDLRSAPEPLWQASIAGASDVVGVIGRTVLVGGGDADMVVDAPARTVSGVDLDTGAIVFTVADPENTCQAGTDTLACVEGRAGQAATVVVRDDQGGTLREVPFPGALSALVLDDDGLAVLEGFDSGVSDLVRIDAEGDELWRAPTSFSGRVDTSYNDLRIVDGSVETATGPFDLATGDRIEDPRWRAVSSDSAGTTVSVTAESTVVTTAGGEQLTLPPDERVLDIDDALGGPIALTGLDDGSLAVHPREDDRPLWTITEDACWLLARLDGVLVMRCFQSTGTQILALDQLSGDPLWERPGDIWADGLGASDDTLLLTTGDGVSGVDPVTGEERWALPVPGDWMEIETAADAVILVTSEVLVRLA